MLSLPSIGGGAGADTGGGGAGGGKSSRRGGGTARPGGGGGRRRGGGDFLKMQARLKVALQAITQGRLADFLPLLRRGVPVDAATKMGDTALIRAAELGHVEWLQALLTAGADVEWQNSHGRTALVKAACAGHTSVVGALMGAGADLFATDDGGKSALDWARLAGHDAVAAQLEAAIAENVAHRRQLKYGSEKLRELAAKGVESVAENRGHCATMLAAVQSGEMGRILAVLEAVEFPRAAWEEAVRSLEIELSSETCYLDVQTRAGWTALTLAVANGEEQAALALMERRAAMDQETKRGHTPLIWAAICGHRTLAVMLLVRGADVDYASRLERKRALHHAAFNGQDAIVELLLEKVHDVALAKKQEAVEDAEANPGAKDKVELAKKDWYYWYAERLHAVDSSGRDALAYASERGHAVCVLLIECALTRARERKAYLDTEAERGRRVRCELGCGLAERADRIEQHQNHECPRRLVGCPDCAQFVPECEVPEHIQAVCPKRFVACHNAYLGCLTSLKWEDLELHTTHKCKKRIVECRLGCGKRTKFDERDAHEQRECARRYVFCPRGCGAEFCVEERAAHMASECPLRTVTCRVSCGLKMKAAEQAHHEEEVCRAPCQWGCGAKIGPLDRRALHERFVCPKRLVEDPSGCGIPGITAEILPDYLSHRCPKRLVPCPLGSGEMIASDEVDTWVHPEKGGCPNRLVRCRLDYVGKRIRVYSVIERKWEVGQVEMYHADDGSHEVRFEGGSTALRDQLKDLDFEEVEDTRWDCGWLIATDLPTHMAECPHALVDCPFGSGQRVRRADLARHVSERRRWVAESAINDAAMIARKAAMAAKFASEQAGAAVAAASARQAAVWVAWEAVEAADAAVKVADAAVRTVTRVVECHCGVMLLFTRMRSHRLNECPEEHVQCTQGCGQKVRRAVEDHHAKHECSRRQIQCLQGCGKPVFFDEQHVHNTTVCAKRSIQCPALCGTEMRAEELQDHMFSCVMRKLTCGATTRQLRSWSDGWVLTYCPHTRETALTYAARFNDVKLAQWLADGTTEVNFEHETSSGETALTRACYFGHYDMVWFLIQRGADINHETQRGRTALIEAAAHNHADIVQLLLREHVHFEPRNKHRRTPIEWARACKATDALPLLHAILLVQREKRGLFLAITTHNVAEVQRIVGAGEPYRFNHPTVLEAEQRQVRGMLEGLMEEADQLTTLLGPLRPHVRRLQDALEGKEEAARQLIVEADRIADLCEQREARLKSVMRDAMLAVGRTHGGDIGDVTELRFPQPEQEDIAHCMCVLLKAAPERVRQPKHNAVVERDSWWRPFQRLLLKPNLLHAMRFINKNNLPGMLEVRQLLRRVDGADPENDCAGYAFMRAALKWVKAIALHEKTHADLKPQREAEGRARVEYNTQMQMLWQERKTAKLQASRLWDLERQQTEAVEEYEKNKHMITIYREKLRVARLLESQTEFGHTATSWCCAVGNPEMMKLLAKHGAPVNYTAFHMRLAAAIIQCKFRHYRWLCHRVPWSTGLSKEYRMREINHFFEMRSTVVKLEKQRALARAPLAEAFYNGNQDIVDVLLNLRDQDGHLRGPYPSRLTWNRPIGPPPMSVNYEPLSKRMSILECALLGEAEHGSMNYVYGDGWVEANGHTRCVARARDIWTKCEMEVAGAAELKKAKLAVRDRVREETRLKQELDDAVRELDFEEVIRLADLGAPIDHETSQGHTALTMASAMATEAKNADGETCLAITLLLDREHDEPDVNNETVRGHTPLTYAARNGHIFVIEELLNYKAEINLHTSKDGKTALIHAACNGKWESVRLLLECGADVHHRDHSGRTAVDWARELNFINVLRRLSEYQSGFLVKAKTEQGKAVEVFLCSFGCGAMLPEKELREHEELHCMKRVVKCSLGCPIENMWASEVAEHEAHDCPKRTVPCPLKCGEDMRFDETQEHLDEACRKRVLRCRVKGCEEEMPAKDLQTHEEHACKFRPVPCADCKQGVPFNYQLLHKREQCMMRKLVCPLGCGTVMWAKFYAEHAKSACPNRILPCKHAGCEDDVQARSLLRHETSECLKRPVSCQLHCGERVLFCQIAAHEAHACGNRFMDCALGCGHPVLAKLQEEHEAEECPKRVMSCPMCGDEMVGSAYEHHAHSFCLKRAAPCGLGCGEMVVNDQSAWHKENECAKRIVPCGLACGKSMEADKLPHHEKWDCRKRIIFCKYGCKVELVADTFRRHAKQVCPMALIECNLGCGKVMRRHEMEHHVNKQCVRR